MIGVIYKWVNVINSKAYIGQTLNQKRRYKEFLNSGYSYTSKDSKIDRARAKYGISAFRYEILEKIESEDKDYVINKLNELEVHYIQQYDSILHGYNTMEGGKSYNHREGYKCQLRRSNECNIKCTTFVNYVLVPNGMDEQGLRPVDQYVYAILKSFNGSDGCFPSQQSIADRSKISVPTISKVINKLVKEGYVCTEIRHRHTYYTFPEFDMYEPFSPEFLKNDDITPTTKAYIVAAQQYMFKDEEGIGKMSYSYRELSDKLNMPVMTIHDCDKELKRKKYLTLLDEKVRDIETGCKKKLKIFNLSDLGQAVIWKLKEHEERITNNEQDIAELKKKCERLEKLLERARRTG